ncbi:hypothetical protein K7432_010233 [Basidiobolus ranarum]|uniref:Glycosyl transferase family 1 domain-containing protein n=1 Tax=Basidiobolus ranarum TaxID=34480 RepID=A0ABR2WP08_9FUNG
MSYVPKQLPRKNSRIIHDDSLPQPIYIGIHIENNKDDNSTIYCIYTHDGSYPLDYSIESVEAGTKLKEVEDSILDDLVSYASAQHYKIHTVAISRNYPSDKEDPDSIEAPPPSIAGRLWFEFDAIPFLVATRGQSPDERACAAVRKSIMWMSPQFPGSITRVAVSYNNEVDVDLNGEIHMCDLSHYKAITESQTWTALTKFADEIKDRKLKISFFNATPRGGGVALMRHANIRLLRLLGVDAHWFVVKPKPNVFDITKRKFHNVLQGVAPKDVRLSEDDKEVYRNWIKTNADRWSVEDGPFRHSDVIIIDDPQVSGLVPYIRQINPKCKIIYRSHIEVRADLVADESSPQAETWNFIWDFIKDVDLFISHPVANFIPESVPEDKVVLLPAATDPLDGLNKGLNLRDMEYYRLVFNRICYDQHSPELRKGVPYIIQVARFDPSKGIPDVLEAYKLLRDRLKAANKRPTPQLVICGHGSVDDPDGAIIYQQVLDLLAEDRYVDLANDVCVVRVPGSDQLLNSILRGAHIALQLSHREGFEVKVTEALAKGVPVVAYNTGGIPLQIVDGRTGYLVEALNVEKVVDKMFDLFTNQELYRTMSEHARKEAKQEYFTQFNTANWLYAILEVLKHDDVSNGKCWGHRQWLKSFWYKE